MTRKKKSQENRLFSNGRNICKFIFNLGYILKYFRKIFGVLIHACRKVYLAKSFDIQFMKVNSRVTNFFPLMS